MSGMKKIIDAAKRIASRVHTIATKEPVAVRAAVASVVNLLVLSGAVGVGFGDEADAYVEGGLLVVANLGLLFGARAKVTPGS